MLTGLITIMTYLWTEIINIFMLEYFEWPATSVLHIISSAFASCLKPMHRIRSSSCSRRSGIIGCCVELRAELAPW